MAEILIATPLLSLEDFVAQYAQAPFEYNDGEIIELMPAQITRSGRTGGFIFLLIAPYVQEHGLGEVFIEVPFVLVMDTRWVKGSRTPDIMFYGTDKLQALRAADADWEDKPLVGVPDLVIEIVSPTDSYSAVIDKINGYRRDGVALIWLVEAKQQRLSIFTAQGQTTLTDPEAVVSGGPALPGFEVRLKQLFQP
ncbi:MAG: Uma2 family endonuclease [Anaerolineae bacterium]|jgi:Uma2 family endonuclease|nr:Uma2 family endonuclease [Anaerolineae bacterium]